MASITEVLKTDIAFKNDFVRTATGDLDLLSGLENIKIALFRRLMTTPGTIIHRPNYGVGLKNFQNAPSSLGLQQDLAKTIQEQFEQDPRVQSVTGVAIHFDDYSPSRTTIVVRVELEGYTETQMTFVPFGG